MARTPTEEFAVKIAGMGQAELVDLLRTMDCAFDLDFSAEYLGSLSLERLRHIALAALLHRRPTEAPRR